MDPDGANVDKAAFLAASADSEFDERDPVEATRVLSREILARQIDQDDPPEVWRTAQRLLGTDLDAPDVMRQLVLALGVGMSPLVEDADFDHDGYLEALERLPLPTSDDVEQAFVDVVGEHQPVGADEAERLVAERLGMADHQLTERMLDQVEEELLDDGPLAMLAPDRLVHVPSLLSGIVLTHRLTDDEREVGVLHATDLPGFARTDPTWQGETVLEYEGEDGRTRWFGPSAWLADLPSGALIAVRVGPDGEVSLTPLDDEPVVPDELVAALRSAYTAGSCSTPSRACGRRYARTRDGRPPRIGSRGTSRTVVRRPQRSPAGGGSETPLRTTRTSRRRSRSRIPPPLPGSGATTAAGAGPDASTRPATSVAPCTRRCRTG